MRTTRRDTRPRSMGIRLERPANSLRPPFGIRQNVEDDPSLGFRVCPAIVAPYTSSTALHFGVRGARPRVGAEVIAKKKMRSLPIRSGIAYMDVHLARVAGDGTKVSMQIISAAELKSGSFQRLNVHDLVTNVGDTHLDVNDGLGHQTWDRRRTDMIDPLRSRTQLIRNSAAPRVKPMGPYRVVVDDQDWISTFASLRGLEGRPNRLHRRAGELEPLLQRELVRFQTSRLGDKSIEVDNGRSLTLDRAQSLPGDDGIRV
jgi:hypothetical protein